MNRGKFFTLSPMRSRPNAGLSLVPLSPSSLHRSGVCALAFHRFQSASQTLELHSLIVFFNRSQIVLSVPLKRLARPPRVFAVPPLPAQHARASPRSIETSTSRAPCHAPMCVCRVSLLVCPPHAP